MNLLYFSPVSWKWIKQRPHFLTEMLAASGHNVVYCFRSPMGKGDFKNFHKRVSANLAVSGYKVLPFALRCSWIEKFNNFYLRKLIFRKNYDAVILADPRSVNILPEAFTGKVIYECMDHYGAFYSGKKRTFIENSEKKLCFRADSIIVSSNKLREHLICKYGLPGEKITLIRNAVSDELFFDRNTQFPSQVDFSYIGTIGDWFDWESVVACAEALPQCRIRLIGPCESTPVALPANIELYGTVPHEKVAALIKSSKVLLMPFKVNELIQAVDPVKMYEYLSLGKNVLAVFYEELEYFKSNDKLHFYRNKDEFVRQAKKLFKQTLCSAPDLSFYESNNWKSRTCELKKVLQKIKN